MAIDHKWEYARYPACQDARLSIIDRTGESFVSSREAELTIAKAFCRGETVVRFHCDSAKKTAKSALSKAPCGKYQYSVNEAQNCGIIVKNT